MSDPEDRTGYEISVRRDDVGRGGSLFMHRHVQPGMEMTLSYPVNLFALDNRAKKHLMIAGGIGITPFLAQIAQISHFGGRFELHYSARSPALGAYIDRLMATHPERVHCYFDDAKQMIDLKKVLENQPIGTHLYVCGPKGMIAWVLATAESMGWPKQALHSEEFIAPGTGLPFEVQLAASGKTITVGTTQSLLEAMEAAGVDAPYLCRGGACGQCETNVHKCDGTILHRDHWLSPEEHAEGRKIMPCVSRFEGKTLVIDR
jgi:dimethylamine monooxygenase subunit B